MLTSAAALGCLLIALLWGAAPVAQRVLLDMAFSPQFVFVFGSLLYLLGVVAFAAWNWRAVAPGFAMLTGRAVGLFVVASVLGALVANLVWIFVLRGGSSVGILSTLTAAFPLVTALLAYLLLGERLGGLAWLGVALVLAGVVAVALDSESSPSPQSGGAAHGGRTYAYTQQPRGTL
jgi:drug/metabolite transporter (DMT)-like permease